MPHTISVHGSVVEIRLSGDQKYDDIVALGHALEKYAHDGVIDKVLVDISAMSYPDPGARRVAFELASKYRYNKVAILRGESHLNTALVIFIARQSKRVRAIRAFSQKIAALAWLQNGADT